MRARLCELYILGQSLLIAQFLAAGFTANAQTEASICPTKWKLTCW
jgi:hypothetical protein